MSTENTEKPQATNLDSPFLGLGALATQIALSSLFLAQGQSLGYALGGAIGQATGAGALALPVLLIWRFFTSSGRSRPLGFAFNVFALLAVAIWLLLFVIAKPALDSMPRSVSQGISTLPRTDNFEPSPTPLGLTECLSESERVKKFGMFADLVPPCTPSHPAPIGEHATK